MFWRILWRLLCASRGRLALALLAVASGATVCAALVNLDLDATDKLTREFRSLGANVIVSPAETGDAAATMDSGVMERLNSVHATEVIAAAPYLYLAAEGGSPENSVPIIVAGTWFDQVSRMNSWWKVAGGWILSRDDRTQCMAGQQAARLLGLSPGSPITLQYAGKTRDLTVAGVVTTGGSEDNQIFVTLPVAQDLAGLGDRIGVVQVSVQGSSSAIEGIMQQLAAVLPNARVQPVRQLAAADGRLLESIHGLLVATITVILLLTALGVLASMAGLAMERRRDVGLMKALGGSVRRIMRFFLAEATAIGAVGGIVGCAAGMLLAGWMGERVFATSISPRLVVLPITMALMIGVALAGALPLRLLGRVRPADILRGE